VRIVFAPEPAVRALPYISRVKFARDVKRPGTKLPLPGPDLTACKN
jgi:hypothetical protein